jgi:putative ABC transport system permease protein
MKATLREWVSRLAGMLGLRRADSDMEQELRTHLMLAEDDLRRQGMSATQAAQQARRQYGRPTQTMEALRDQSAFPQFGTFWLDVKLGLRMLRKHWGLTLMGGFVMTIAITVGTSFFGFLRTITGDSLPLDEGNRVVVIQPWNSAIQVKQGSSTEDYQGWRERLRSVVDISAFRTSRRNLAIGSGPANPVPIAEMSASGFRLARVAPQLGNFFTDEDERPGATAVVVIGNSVWRTRFGADRTIVGQLVRIDGIPHTIIGVMPEGFAFPVNHEFWTPLNSSKPGRVTVFARVAPGVSLEGAQAEVRSVGLVTPATGTAGPQPQPRVVPYIVGINGATSPLLTLLPLLFALLLVPPCLNMAVLVYARTVARQGEFAARMALGASRRRIVGQIFTEVLLLTLGASGVALVLASKGTEVLSSIVAFGDRPFWMTFNISYQTILFTLGLAVFAAIVAGGLPALQVTRRWQLSGLHSLNRSTAPRLGKAWTAAVVLQVALSVAIVPTIAEFTWWKIRPGIVGPGFKAEEYLTARLALDPNVVSDAPERLVNLGGNVTQQLSAEPGVIAVTLSKTAPFEEQGVSIEVKSEDADGGLPRPVSFNEVDNAFYDALNLRLLTGRSFESGDADPRRDSIVVNQSFTQQVLGSRNPLGSRVRVIASDDVPASATSGEYEIVGVVSDFSTEQSMPTVYRPMLPASQQVNQVRITLHLSSAASTNIASRLRQIANGLDPSLQVDDVQTLAEIYWLSSLPGYIIGVGIAGLVLCLVLFAVAGIYTLMTFAVVQRRREIGIRSALGASPVRLAAGVFRRVLLPVLGGVVLGGVAAILVSYFVSPLLFDYQGNRHPMPSLLLAAEACALLIGVAAVLGPARRALAVNVAEAIRND